VQVGAKPEPKIGVIFVASWLDLIPFIGVKASCV
jgi:hypothetical protein